MKQLEKKDLIIGEIYFRNRFIFKHVNTDPYLCDNYVVCELHNSYYHGNGHIKMYNESPQRLATAEEKHWLETCIKADKFVSYEEAMKTFIPEYVECTLQQIGSDYKLDEIYKVISISQNVNKIESHNNQGVAFYQMNKHRFKPSTKEAYDAQFVVKEPEFVLSKLWCIKLTFENQKTVIDYINKNSNDGERSGNIGMYYGYNGEHCTCIFKTLSNTEITFEQFKKYVLKEQLEEPKDKVLNFQYNNLPNIEKVQCSEGAVYKLGDKITVFTKNSPNKGKPFTIKSFRWSNDKSKICAITEVHTPNGIGLNKIELYVEPIVKELSLLEQAKLKYPVGCKIKSILSDKIVEIKNHNLFQIASNNITVVYDNGLIIIYNEEKWAEIVEDFILPETWWVTIENQKQLEIAKQYLSQYFHTVNHIGLNSDFGYVKTYINTNHWSYLSKETRQNNPQITFKQFKQYVLHNGFKVGDIINNGNWIIYDLQYINGHSVAFYKYVESGNTSVQCRILTKNIVK